MSEPVLRAVGIGKRFGGLVAVDRVDLDLFPSQIHAVIGPNGAGKSTFLATLAGDLAPSSGRVSFQGRDITDASVQARTRMGIGRTYQRSAVIPNCLALDMARIAALHASGSFFKLLKPIAALTETTRRAREALARVGLSRRENVDTNVLSHGEKRRLEIAAVLALDPQILLLDEPLAGLGPDECNDVIELVADLKKTCAIILIEHDIDFVFSVADRITVLDDGRVIASGDPAQVRGSAAVQQAYLGADGEV
ncbi:MAG: ABC transporter ATP-binding protein [Bradyrhizobium sp.]